MPAFRCIAIPTATADCFRSDGVDDYGNKLREMQATPDGLFPCRHCLNYGLPGEAMLLGSYKMPRPLGIYWSPSPIFVHRDRCPRFELENEIAPIIRRGVLVSVRAYDDADQCIYDLGQVSAGSDVDKPLANALADSRTAFVNVHTARPGCMLARVERVS
ncbi:MAG TPA: DUF1203 domain-containing protein [Rhodoblastus sp.]|nr:DUF1203 domain-containing protein [Rhodoblastus sp.]